MLSGSEKSARYEERQLARGLRKVHLWVPENRAAELTAIAERMRRERACEEVRDRVVSDIKRLEKSLGKRGITGLALFGSLARGDGAPDSDVDLVADIDAGANLSILDIIGIEQMLEDRLDRGVDLLTRQGLKKRFAAAIAPDEYRIF